ncbi:MAG: hypothetical protein WEA24_10340 [Gemmatimonadota bacterium]
MKRSALLLLILPLLMPLTACDGARERLAGALSAQVDTSATTRRLLDAEAVAGLRGAVSEFRLLPDGSGALAADWETGELVLVDLKAGSSRELTHNVGFFDPGYAWNPIISPDGTRAVFHWVASGAPGPDSLFVVELPDGEPRALFEVPERFTGYDWSPDGTVLAGFHTTEAREREVALLHLEDGRLERVVGGVGSSGVYIERMEFSPDGRYLVFDAPEPADSFHLDLKLVDIAARELRPLVAHSGNQRLLGWVPGTDRILYLSDALGTPAAWLQHVTNGRTSGEPVLVKPDLWNAGAVGLTESGNLLYHVSSRSRNVFAVDLNARTGELGEPRALLPRVAMPKGGAAAVSPDGRAIAVGIGTDPGAKVLIRSLETGLVQEYPLPASWTWVMPEWLEDGSGLLLRVSTSDIEQPMFRLDFGSGELTRVELGDVQFRPYLVGLLPGTDSMLVLLHSEEGESPRWNELVMRDLATGGERSIVREEACAIMRPALGPQGQVAYRRRRVGEDAAYLVARDAGGRLLLQLEDRDYFDLLWHPDGTLLWAKDSDPQGNSRLHRLPMDGGEITSVPIEHNNPIFSRLSPDGTRLIYTAGTGASELWILENLPLGGAGG